MVLFFQIKFSISFEESSLQGCKCNIWVKTVKPLWYTFCILHLPISYRVSLIWITITRHIFLYIFQTEHISAVKFDKVYEENMRHPCDAKISKSLKNWKWIEDVYLVPTFGFPRLLSKMLIFFAKFYWTMPSGKWFFTFFQSFFFLASILKRSILMCIFFWYMVFLWVILWKGGTFGGWESVNLKMVFKMFPLHICKDVSL